MRFVNNDSTTTPDDQMTKIKVVGLQNLCNFESFLI
jgi:hypothetical protein